MIRALTVWALLLLVVLALTGCNPRPSCADLGGRLVHDGITHMAVGKVTVPITRWRCEGAAQ